MKTNLPTIPPLVLALVGMLIGLTGARATTNPIGLWHFDETSGASAADSSGNGRTVTLAGGYTHAAGHASNGITFNGSTGYGSAAWNQLTGHTARSVSLWFRTSSTANSSWVSWGTTGTNTLSEIGIKGGNVGYIGSPSVTTYDCTTPITTSTYANGAWHHLTVTFNPSLHCMELYLDGILKMSRDRYPATGTSSLYFGQSALTGNFFNGSLDEVAIYDRAISATEVATVSGLGSYPIKMVSVLSPAYCSDVSGTITVSIVAPGFTSATAKCWQSGGTYGSDTTLATMNLTGANGSGSFSFPAASYPHGPTTIRITGTDGTLSDTCYLQLYNTVGTSWHEGIPASAPPAAAGLSLVYQDDFTSMPSISWTGAGATYTAQKPGGGNWGYIPFTDPASVNTPFSQRDTYLKIRTDSTKNSTGFISSLRTDMTGFTTKAPCYLECRFVSQDAPSSWPAFWLLTFNGTSLSSSLPHDEEDIIEAYGGDGGGASNTPISYSVNSHEWAQTGLPAGDHISLHVNMASYGGFASWSMTPHVYGCLIGTTDTVFYLDNIEIGRKTTSPVSLTDNFWFMINLAAGGSGWPLDLSRYNGTVDMYVDYVRVYAANLPTPWVNQDVGTPGVAGNTTYASGTFSVSGSGTGISGTSDTMQYAYQPASGDCTITARLATTTNSSASATAGVMIRETLSPDSTYAATVLQPGGVTEYLRRITTATVPTVKHGTGSPPDWIRVTRIGNSFTSYTSTDGVTWSQLGGGVTITMGTNVYIGLSQSSAVNTTSATTTFDNVTVTP